MQYIQKQVAILEDGIRKSWGLIRPSHEQRQSELSFIIIIIVVVVVVVVSIAATAITTVLLAGIITIAAEQPQYL